jgi:hypothetical protein
VTAVGEFIIASATEPWRRIGLNVVDNRARIGGVTLRFEPAARAETSSALAGWGLVGAPTDLTDIDGLATTHVEEPQGAAPAHPLEVVGFDHVVVMTSSLERTCGAIEAATGEPLKRVREAGSVRQGFHRLGEVIVEVVESAQVTSNSASFWGFVWNVADLHEVCATLGPDVISLPKPAVQPGRFIATVRTEIGLGLPLALMTPP